MLKILTLAIKLLWREWRAGEWAIVCLSLLLAITASTSVHFYTDRLTQGLDKQSARFLGGDLVISSSSAIPSSWRNKAEQLNLRTAEVWTYPSVISSNDQLQLVNLQAVSDNYPLLGEKINHPEKETVWAEARLLPLLKIGLHAKATIGRKEFEISKLLTSDIDSLNTGWAIAPRAMIRLDDALTTGTVVPGSRIDYRLLLTGGNSSLHLFKKWIQPQLLPGQKMIEVHNQRFALSGIIQRTQDYMELILLFCLMLSGIAIALSIRSYLKRHYTHIALWRCLGATQHHIRMIFIIQLLIIAVVMGALGVTIGYVIQSVFIHIFKDYIPFTLPPASYKPLLLGFIISNLLLFTFSYPLIRELPKISPLAVWRGEIAIKNYHQTMSTIVGIVILILIVAWFTHFSTLTWYFCIGLTFSIAILYGISIVLLDLLGILIKNVDGTIRNGLSQIVHHGHTFSLQFVGFNLILIALSVSALVKTDLVGSWQKTLSKSAPNYFAINIARGDIIKLQQFFSNQHVEIEGIYPMVRGRLIALNKTPIFSAIPKAALNHNALHRDLNLSAMWVYPSDNRIVKGDAWTLKDAGKPYVSVENTLANELNLHIGDKLTFQVSEKQFTATIINLRSLVWSSIHPNFFMIFPPGMLDSFPMTFITSFHLAPDQTLILNDIIKLFPNITIIDMANLLQQMQGLLGHIITSIQYLFAFSIGIGVLIFLTSLQASMDERRQTYHLFQVLGADRNYLLKSIIVELTCFIILITLTTTCITLLITKLLTLYVFNL